MTDQFRAMCAELFVKLKEWDSSDPYHDCRARALLAQPVAESPAEGEVAELVAWLRDRADSTSIAANANRASRIADLLERPTPQPPADGEAAELAAELRHFVAGYQQMRGLDPEHVYSIHRGDAMEAHLRISRLSRIAELLTQPVEQLHPTRQAHA